MCLRLACDQNSTQILLHLYQFDFSYLALSPFTFGSQPSLFVPLVTPEKKRKSRELQRRTPIRIGIMYQREINLIKRASSEESRPNRHYVSEGIPLCFVNHWNSDWILRSFIGGLPSESVLCIKGKLSVLPQSLESWPDIEKLHRRNPIWIGIPYLAYQMENPPSIDKLAGEDLWWFPILICHLTHFNFANLAGSAWGNNYLHNSIQLNFNKGPIVSQLSLSESMYPQA